MDLITVSGSGDDAPTVEVDTPMNVTGTQFTTLSAGSGTPIVSDDQLVVLDARLLDATTGEIVGSTRYSGDLSAVYPVSTFTQSFPGLHDALQCATAGARIVAALPPSAVDAQAAQSLGMGADDSMVAVLDVRKVYLSRADGADQYNAGTGLPSVVRAPNGRPGVIVPDGAPPQSLTVQVLKKGDGDAVAADAAVRIHYTGVVWSTRKVFGTTWDSEPESVSLSAATLPGLGQALAGQTVGSQVMVVVPPDVADAAATTTGAPTGSTLIFVVDILGIDAAATQ